METKEKKLDVHICDCVYKLNIYNQANSELPANWNVGRKNDIFICWVYALDRNHRS